MLKDLQYLNNSLNCHLINEYYVDIQHDMCFDMINQWFIVYSLQYGIVLLLIIRSLFVCTNGGKYKKSSRDQLNSYSNSSNQMSNNPMSNNGMSNNNPLRQEYGRLQSDVSDQPCYGMMSDDVVLENTPEQKKKKKTFERRVSDVVKCNLMFWKCFIFWFIFCFLFCLFLLILAIQRFRFPEMSEIFKSI